MRCQYCGMLPCICDDITITEDCPDCGREKNACTCEAHACYACGNAPARCACVDTLAPPHCWDPALSSSVFSALERALFGSVK